MRRIAPALVALAMLTALAGCSVLGALAEERVLRGLAVFVLVAALAGLVASRMRR